ncbi:hypothetical protein SBOR_5280 [Sclerotinia borealis F-4128]|uniref:ZZ-type domain-containing protein n=1 Tax=Sclerotinia borealis (strain F-4128) TaxID=1432307 RepID=W9CES5_SCLBF|nr:hypothetical protein SBOR_5280 [Sclerotinia borealis F-4128]
MSLYGCDGCAEPIRPDKARIQCHICTDYNLCANCFVIQNVTRTHVSSHPTMIYKTSGTSTSGVPPPVPPRPVPLLPPRKNTMTSSSTPPKKVELPTANWGALWDIVKPKTKSAKATSSSQRGPGSGSGDLISISPPPPPMTTEEVYGNSNSNSNNPVSFSPITKLRPDLPPRPGKIDLEAFTNPYASIAPPMPLEWSPFFQADGTHNAIFNDLMTTIFLHLDVENTDELSPEVYSAFLDMQGVKMEDNIWQKTLFIEGGIQNQEIADLELGIFFKNHEIAHTLSTRHSSNLPPPSPSPTAGERIRRSISLGANMPMLSKQGFIDVMGMELVGDPEEGWRRLRGVVQDYGVWRGLGDVPRECFLEGPVEGGGMGSRGMGMGMGMGMGKRRSLLEMSEEKEEVERRIMEGMFRGAGAGEKVEGGDANADEDLEVKEEMEMEIEMLGNMPAPESFAFDTTDDEDKLEDQNHTQSQPQPRNQTQPQTQTHIKEVDLIQEDEDEDEDEYEYDMQTKHIMPVPVRVVVEAVSDGDGDGDGDGHVIKEVK